MPSSRRGGERARMREQRLDFRGQFLMRHGQYRARGDEHEHESVVGHPWPTPPDDLLESAPSPITLDRTPHATLARDEPHSRHFLGRSEHQEQATTAAERGASTTHRGEIIATPHAMLRGKTFVMGRNHRGPPRGRHAGGVKQAGRSVAASNVRYWAVGPSITRRRGRGVRPISRTTRKGACGLGHGGRSAPCGHPWSSSASGNRESSSCGDC